MIFQVLFLWKSMSMWLEYRLPFRGISILLWLLMTPMEKIIL
jgi:hypothetical protein